MRWMTEQAGIDITVAPSGTGCLNASDTKDGGFTSVDAPNAATSAAATIRRASTLPPTPKPPGIR